MTQQAQKATSAGFDELPLPALALIYQCCDDAASRRALLGVARWGRDTVLRKARSLQLELHDADTAGTAHQPLAGLLNRACTSAEPGQLSLKIQAAQGPTDWDVSGLLSALLRWGSDEGGWLSVWALHLSTPSQMWNSITKVPMNWASMACPALQELHLERMELMEADLQQLAAFAALASLTFTRCRLPVPVFPTTSPLAALKKLAHLGASHVYQDKYVLQGLTQLTSLALVTSYDRMAQLANRLGVMTQLHRLELDNDCLWASLGPAVLRAILSASTQLTHLTLAQTVRQEDLDVLLAHAPLLTSLSCRDIELKEDRSHAACSWKELRIQYCYSIAYKLAYLPLHSLSRLQLGDLHLPSASPHLPMMVNSMYTSVLEQMQQGLLNLERCPAWQQSGPDVHVQLLVSDANHDEWSDNEFYGKLFGILSRLGGRRVHLYMPKYTSVLLDSDVLMELGQALGSSLTALQLRPTDLPSSFWSAVWAHLPGLQELTLPQVTAPSTSVRDVASFCAAATHPLQLRVSRSMYNEVVADAQVKQHCFPPAAQTQVVISALDACRGWQ